MQVSVFVPLVVEPLSMHLFAQSLPYTYLHAQRVFQGLSAIVCLSLTSNHGLPSPISRQIVGLRGPSI